MTLSIELGINIDILDPEMRSKKPVYYAISKFHPREEYMAHVKNVPHQQLAKIDSFVMYEIAEAQEALYSLLENRHGTEYISPESGDDFTIKKFPLTKSAYIIFDYTDSQENGWYWWPEAKYKGKISPAGDVVYNLLTSSDGNLFIWAIHNEIIIYTKGSSRKIQIIEA